ncbi:hypothetical protein EDB83DRAFT_2626817, partial [Lactarius deliciosus]
VSTKTTAVVITFALALASLSKIACCSVALNEHVIIHYHGYFAALVLAIDPASSVLLNRKPDKTDPSFTLPINMIKPISSLGQAVSPPPISLARKFLSPIVSMIFYSTEASCRGHCADDCFQCVCVRQTSTSRLDRLLNVFEGISIS